MTWIMGRAEGRRKETIGRGVAGKRERPKKEREFHLQVHSYIIQCLSSWEMDLCSLHLTLSHPSVHSSPRWREEMSSELGQFPKTRCGKVLFGIHEHNERRLLLLFYRNELPFPPPQWLLPSCLKCPNRKLDEIPFQQMPGKNSYQTSPQPPFSLVSLPLDPPSWTFRSSVKKPKQIHQRRSAVSDLMVPWWSLSLGPQTQHGWLSGQSHCKVLNFSFLLKKK